MRKTTKITYFQKNTLKTTKNNINLINFLIFLLFCVDIALKVLYNSSMEYDEKIFSSKEKLRIVQELVPGKQITLAHVIANPDPIMYRKLGLNPAVDYSKNAIGIVCMTPAESAIVTADIAIKASGVEIGFVDRFSGTLILLGTVSEVSTSVEAVLDYAKNVLKFTTCNLTKT